MKVASSGPRWRRGLTLIEVMTMVVIIGLLAAVAGSSLSRHIKRTKTSEAVIGVDQLWQAAVAYFNTPHADLQGRFLAPQLPPSQPLTPAHAPGQVRYSPDDGDWNNGTWNALNFGMNMPHYYQYGFVNLTDPSGVPAGFASGSPFASPGGPMGGTSPFGSGGAPDGKPSSDKAPDSHKGTEKVTICHIPPGNPANAHSITVGEPALSAHMAHGDTDGACAPYVPPVTLPVSDPSGSGGSGSDPSGSGGSGSDPSASGGSDPSAGGGSDPRGSGGSGDPVAGSGGGDPGAGSGGDPGAGSGGDPVAGSGGDPGGGSGDPSGSGGGGDSGGSSDPLEGGAEAGLGPCAGMSSADGGAPGFYTVAVGNLDDDQDYSYFYRGGVVAPNCEVHGAPAVMQESPLE